MKIKSEEEFRDAIRLYEAESRKMQIIDEIAWDLKTSYRKRRQEIAWAIKEWEERQGKNV